MLLIDVVYIVKCYTLSLCKQKKHGKQSILFSSFPLIIINSITNLLVATYCQDYVSDLGEKNKQYRSYTHENSIVMNVMGGVRK